MTGWKAVIDAIPAEPIRYGFLGSVHAGYSTPAMLAGRSLEDIASAYGRPTWHLDEPATGELIAGWSRKRLWALRFSRRGICTDVIQRLSREPELSWRLRTLGDVRQRAADEVVGWLGQPNGRSSWPGSTILHWQIPGYQFALGFGADGRCTGITHWYVSNPV